ncbi:MAG: NnrS family protein [Amphritea sp.]
MQIQEPRDPKGFALFNLGFRPFFLLSAMSGLILMLIWLVMLTQGQNTHSYYVLSQYWHGHEMLFGYGVAVIAGFLLTAVRNWTSVQTPYGTKLAIITAVWLLGRLLPLLGDTIPGIVIAVTDLAFLPLVAISIGIPIIRSGNYRNLIFLAIFAVMTIANLLVHLQLLGYTENTLATGLQMELSLIVVVMIVMGGRVIPFFTERALGIFQAKKYPLLERIMIPLAAGWLVCDLAGWQLGAGVLAAANAVVQAIRLSGWFHKRMFRTPLIWVLHIAYLFIPVGFALYALSAFTDTSIYLSIHAFAAGAVGSMTLGMMARVSLGHTARPLKVSKLVVIAFILIALAGLVRTLLPLIPDFYMIALHLSGALWMSAWLLFLIPYTPILLRPRMDGQFG